MKCRASCSDPRLQLSYTKEDLGETGCVQKILLILLLLYVSHSPALGKSAWGLCSFALARGWKYSGAGPVSPQPHWCFLSSGGRREEKMQKFLRKGPVSSLGHTQESPFQGQVTPASVHVTPPSNQNQTTHIGMNPLGPDPVKSVAQPTLCRSAGAQLHPWRQHKSSRTGC